jgi:hypothetical protein
VRYRNVKLNPVGIITSETKKIWYTMLCSMGLVRPPRILAVGAGSALFIRPTCGAAGLSIAERACRVLQGNQIALR